MVGGASGRDDVTLSGHMRQNEPNVGGEWPPVSSNRSRTGYLRWAVIVWIGLSTILNYVDRQTLSILAPVLRDEFHLTNQEYSHIVAAFLASYTVMYTVSGRIIDWIGERVGMAISIVWWSLATMAHSLAGGAFSLGVFRFLLGLGEPGNYPAALRATARCFSKPERGLPISIYSSGSALGAIIAPPLVTWIVLHHGWRSAFLIPGALGLLWVVVWLRLYRPQTAAIQASIPGRPWKALLRDRKVLGIVLARFIADPVWYFYLFWIPEYLRRAHGLTLAEIGLFAAIPFIAADFGGILGGYVSDRISRSGVPSPVARCRVLCAAALLAPLGTLTGVVSSAAMAIALISLVAAVCQCWFINTAALASDVCSEENVASVQGLMGTAGSGAGILFTTLIGILVDHYSYVSAFVVAGSMHLVAAVVILCLVRADGPMHLARKAA